MHFKRYITGTAALTLAYIKRFFRDKVGLFFTFIFPVMFLLVFGALNNGGGGVTFNVAIINHSDSQFATEFVQQAKEQDNLDVNENITSADDARERMGRGEIDSFLELPEEFGHSNEQGLPSGNLVVYYEEGSPQSGQTLAMIMQGAMDEINQSLTQIPEPFTVEQRSTATANLSSFDYVFSGLLGFTILSLGIFGTAQGLPAEKKTGAFRRLRASPIGPSQLIVANGLAYMLMGILSIVGMFLVAFLVFDFNMRGDFINLTALILASIVMMFGFGVAIGGWAKNEMQAAPLTNLVAFPMMFLSGVFFPRFLMPEWLQGITNYLPLTPVVDGFRLIMTEGATIAALGSQFLLIGAWTIVIYLVAIKFFRWE